jgi:hypothetical protein
VAGQHIRLINVLAIEALVLAESKRGHRLQPVKFLETRLKFNLGGVLQRHVTCVRSLYTHQNNTDAIVGLNEEMASTVVFCKMCKVPLSGKDQFVGHQMLSHELGPEEAENAWSKSLASAQQYWKDTSVVATS